MTVAPAAAGDARSAVSTAIFSGVSLRAPPVDPHAVAQLHGHRVLRVRRDAPHLGQQVRGQLLQHAQHGAPASACRPPARRPPAGPSGAASTRPTWTPSCRAARSPASAGARRLLGHRRDRLARDEHHRQARAASRASPAPRGRPGTSSTSSRSDTVSSRGSGVPACAATTACTWSTATTVPAPSTCDLRRVEREHRATTNSSQPERARRRPPRRRRSAGAARGCDGRGHARRTARSSWWTRRAARPARRSVRRAAGAVGGHRRGRTRAGAAVRRLGGRRAR